MVKVYLEDGKGAALIALFEDEKGYGKCLLAFASMACESRMRLTESVTAEPLSDLLPVKSYVEDRIKILAEIHAEVLHNHKNKSGMTNEWYEDNYAYMRELKGIISELKTILKHSL